MFNWNYYNVYASLLIYVNCVDWYISLYIVIYILYVNVNMHVLCKFASVQHVYICVYEWTFTTTLFILYMDLYVAVYLCIYVALLSATLVLFIFSFKVLSI